MNAAALREVADLVDQGYPADAILVADAVTVLATIASAARWMERCPNDRLPVSGALVDVRVVEVPVVDEVAS